MKHEILHKVVVISDAGRALGAAAASHLCNAGAQVVVGCESGQGARVRELIHEMRWDGGRIVGVTDLDHHPNPLASLAAAAIEHYGRLDAIVHAPSRQTASTADLPGRKAPPHIHLRMQSWMYQAAAAFSMAPRRTIGRLVLIFEDCGQPRTAAGTHALVAGQLADELRSYDVATTRIVLRSAGQGPGTGVHGRPAAGCSPAERRLACLQALSFAVAQPEGVGADEITLRCS